MKVVKIIPNTFENESRDLREISTLKSMGCNVIVVAKESDNPIDHGVETIRLSSRPLGRFVSNPVVNRLASLYMWSVKVRSLKADVLSCHDIICLFIGWLSTLFIKRKPLLVYDSHEFEYARNVNRSSISRCIIMYFERFLIKKCAFSIMVNKTIAEEVQKLHGLKECPVVVRNIPVSWDLDYAYLERRKNEFLKDNGISDYYSIILYQGGLLTGRGIEKSIEALSYVEDAVLLILGSGSKDYVDELQKLSQTYGVSNRVIFHPAVPHDQLWKVSGIADVGLCNIDNVCLSYYYSLPNKLFEYIQAMVPVVGSDFPEIGRIINDYKVGLCCNPEDPHSIADSIKKLLLLKRDPSFVNHLKEAKNQLCWENESVVLKNAYLNIINKRNENLQ